MGFRASHEATAGAGGGRMARGVRDEDGCAGHVGEKSYSGEGWASQIHTPHLLDPDGMGPGSNGFHVGEVS